MLLARRMCGCGNTQNNCGTVQCGAGRVQPVRTVIESLMLQMRKEHFYMPGGVICITKTTIEGFCVYLKGDVCLIFLG